MIDALNRALTAYDDCPDDQDAHTLAAARFFEIEYGEVTLEQRAHVKRLSFAARCEMSIDEWRTPEGFVKNILESTGVSAFWHTATLHGLASASLTGRTTRPKPELQDYRQRPPSPEASGSAQSFDIAGMQSPYEPIAFGNRAWPERVEAHGMYEAKLAPVFDDIPATHEIIDPKPREWSGPDEPTRVNFRVSAETLLSLGGGS